MPYRLSYSYSLDLCDEFGNPIGQSFPFSGIQFIAAANPQSADLQNAVTAAGTDMTKNITPLAGQLNAPNPSD